MIRNIPTIASFRKYWFETKQRTVKTSWKKATTYRAQAYRLPFTVGDETLMINLISNYELCL